MSDTYSNSGDTVDNQSGQSDQQMNPVDMIRDRLAGRPDEMIGGRLIFFNLVKFTVCSSVLKIQVMTPSPPEKFRNVCWDAF